VALQLQPEGLYETPSLAEDSADWAPDRALVAQIVDRSRQAGRTILTEAESKQVLAAYGIPIAATMIAADAAAAVAGRRQDRLSRGAQALLGDHHAQDRRRRRATEPGRRPEREKAFEAIQTSVAEKVGASISRASPCSPWCGSKDAYELIIGSSLDPQFGPVLLFGTGGQLVEVFKDRALALPPLNSTLARRMMEQTKIYKALKGVRGRKPVDLAALELLLVRFSTLVAEQRWIKEIDINPLLASPEGLMALDARVVVYGPEVTLEQIPNLAIRPYPTRYMAAFTMKDGNVVTIRPIRPEDEPAMVRFHKTLSERSVYLRFFHMMNLEQRTKHERLMRTCFIDYDREMALVAERRNPETGEPEILGREPDDQGPRRRGGRGGRRRQRPMARPRPRQGTDGAPAGGGRRRQGPRAQRQHPPR
jgi:acetyltransferase